MWYNLLTESETRMPREIWKKTIHSDEYEVSNLGRVKSFKRYKDGRILAQAEDKDGYKIMSLWKDHKQIYTRIHVLVLESFVGPRPEGYVACHKDGSKDNNRLENLKWGTHMDNTLDSIKHRTHRYGEKNPKAKITENDVLYIRKAFKRTGRTTNRRELASKFNLRPDTIIKIVERKLWKHVK